MTALGGVVMLGAVMAEASTVQWTAGDGSFSNAANWSTGQMPGSSDRVGFGALASPEPYAVALDVDATTDAISVDAGDVSFVSDGPGISRTWQANGLKVFGGDLSLESGEASAPMVVNLGGGRLSIDSGQLSTGYSSQLIDVGDVAVGQTASLLPSNLVSGTTLVQAGSASTVVGAASGAPSSIYIAYGRYVTGTGPIRINRTGAFTLRLGTLNANGDITIDGGSLTLFEVWGPDSTFRVAEGKTITVQNGGAFAYGGRFHPPAGEIIVRSGSSMHVASIDLGEGVENQLTIDGIGSSLTTGIADEGSSGIGTRGRYTSCGSGVLTVRNGATAALAVKISGRTVPCQVYRPGAQRRSKSEEHQGEPARDGDPIPSSPSAIAARQRKAEKPQPRMIPLKPKIPFRGATVVPAVAVGIVAWAPCIRRSSRSDADGPGKPSSGGGKQVHAARCLSLHPNALPQAHRP